MEEAYQIFSYLPLRYRNDKETVYVQYLRKAFENNYQDGQYQFAFMSYHMLFMCFVYFTIWKIKSIHPEDYDKISLGFHNCIQGSNSPFGYCGEQERKIMQVFKFWGIGNERIGAYRKLVDARNDIAHSNGNIFYKDQQSINSKIADVLKFCDEIQQKTKPTIEKSMAIALDNDPNVKMFFKIPSNFKIDTPIGKYNPDWAVYLDDDGVKKLYFVLETKGSSSLFDLRTPESLRIKCGKQHFKALDNGVEMHVATNWGKIRMEV